MSHDANWTTLGPAIGEPRGLSIVVVEDDEAMREAISARLESWGHRVAAVADAESAHERIRETSPDLVLADVVLPDASGLDLLKRLRAESNPLPFVLMTAHAEVDLAVQAMKQGAADFLTKPIDADHLRSLVAAIREDLESRANARRLESRLAGESGLGRLVGASPPMLEIFELVKLLARNDASAILGGESGTGKEMVARSIHELSGRSDRPFVALNCAAIPAGLIESELFGHVRGAFTGATRDRPGCFELADGGVLLLDEIVEMPLELQPKLLRILEEGRARRVGGSTDIVFDVRVLAATNRDPQTAIREGRLREDLYYRLAVFQLNLPPLRRRRGDIPLLAQAFVREANRKHGCQVEGVQDAALQMLQEYGWPGNVRELRNVIERSAIVAGSGLIEPAHLPPFLRGTGSPGSRNEEVIVVEVGTSAREAEKQLILRTLEHVDGNKAEAARRLGLDVKTIRNKLMRYETDEAEGA
jgi:DNA-binding NtrC family response regulator